MWTTELAKRANTNPDRSVLVQNAGVNGNTTRLALERLHYDVLSQRPDAVYVQFGINDANFWQTDFGLPRVTERSFESNLIEIVEKIVGAGTRLVIIATNHPTNRMLETDIHDVRYNSSNGHYNELIRRAFRYLSGSQKDSRIELVDNEYWWQERGISASSQLDSYLLSDGVHLSRLGHLEYINSTVPAVISALLCLRNKMAKSDFPGYDCM